MNKFNVKSFFNFLWILVGLGIFILFLIFIGSRDLPNIEQYTFEWQKRTHGIAPSAGPMSHRWQAYFLKHTAADVSFAVLGTSSVSGFEAQTFHNSGMFNYAYPLAQLECNLTFASYLIENAPHLKTLIFSIDAYADYYELRSGCNYRNEIEEVLQSPELQPKSFYKDLEDTLKSFYYRSDQLIFLGRKVYIRFRRLLYYGLSHISEWNEPIEIPCTESRRPSLDVTGNTCLGFNEDGSFTFWKKNTFELENGVQGWIDGLSQRVYTYRHWQAFDENSKNFYPKVMAELAELNKKAKAKNISLVVILPPLAPGAEPQLLKSVPRDWEMRFKNEMRSMADKFGLNLIEAGDSEAYSCTKDEFYTITHATSDCLKKIMDHEHVTN